MPREDEDDIALEDGVQNGGEAVAMENGANGSGVAEAVDMQE